MLKIIPITLRPAMLAALLAIGGCASTNSGLSDEALSGDPTAMWSDGQKMTVRGESEAQKGERQVEEGRKQIREGEAMVQRGSDLVSSIRFEYQTAASNGGTATTPKAVAAEARALKAIGSRWEDAIEMIRDGNRLIERGNQTLDEAQTQIRKGRTLVEQGSTLMRNSERMRLGEDLLAPAAVTADR